MNRKIRIGIMGMTHGHLWGHLRDLKESEVGELVAAADPNPPLIEKIQSEYNCSQTFQSYRDMLEKVKLDVVYVFADNATSVDLVEMAVKKGLHVMVEKPMAATLAGADRMLAAARKNNVLLMINWPNMWNAKLQQAFVLTRAGEIGRITGVKYRAAHAGPKEIGCSPYFYRWLFDKKLNGGGALIDYCCYGAAIARYLLGQPSRIVGVTGRLDKDYITVEDNAVIIMQWSRAISITEASWTEIGELTSYATIIYGTKGTIVSESGEEGELRLATQQHRKGILLDVPEPKEELKNATNYFLSCINKNLSIEGLCSPEVGRDAQEILEAGLISAAKETAISLPLPIFPAV